MAGRRRRSGGHRGLFVGGRHGEIVSYIVSNSPKRRGGNFSWFLVFIFFVFIGAFFPFHLSFPDQLHSVFFDIESSIVLCETKIFLYTPKTI